MCAMRVRDASPYIMGISIRARVLPPFRRGLRYSGVRDISVFMCPVGHGEKPSNGLRGTRARRRCMSVPLAHVAQRMYRLYVPRWYCGSGLELICSHPWCCVEGGRDFRLEHFFVFSFWVGKKLHFYPVLLYSRVQNTRRLNSRRKINLKIQGPFCCVYFIDCSRCFTIRIRVGLQLDDTDLVVFFQNSILSS